RSRTRGLGTTPSSIPSATFHAGHGPQVLRNLPTKKVTWTSRACGADPPAHTRCGRPAPLPRQRDPRHADVGSGVRAEVDDEICEKDKLVAAIYGRHLGKFLGRAPTGKEFAANQIHTRRLEDERKTRGSVPAPGMRTNTEIRS